MTKAQLGSLTNFNSAANSVTSETINVQGNLFYISLPFTDSRGEVIGLPTSFNITDLPKKTTMALSGEFRGTESEIRSFVAEIEDETLDDDQDKKLYIPAIGFTGRYYARINNFSYVTLTNTNKIGWTMELILESVPS